MSRWGKSKQILLDLKALQRHSELVRTGRMLAIDPASKSLGWALFEKGIKVDGGKIVSKKINVNDRLIDLSEQLKKRFKNVDVLAVEKIRGSTSHDYLKWSIGAIMVSIGAIHFVEVPIQFWKKLTDSSYVKDDDNDAAMIGQVVITIMEDLHYGQEQRTKAKRKQGVRHGATVKGRKSPAKKTASSTSKRRK